MSTEEKIPEYQLERKQKKVRIGGELMTLEEMDGLELASWRKEMSDRAKFNPNGQMVGLRSYTGVEAELISRCLKNERGEFVKKEIITSWPVSLQQSLIRMCEDLNGLTPDKDDESKKG